MWIRCELCDIWFEASPGCLHTHAVGLKVWEKKRKKKKRKEKNSFGAILERVISSLWGFSLFNDMVWDWLGVRRSMTEKKTRERERKKRKKRVQPLWRFPVSWKVHIHTLSHSGPVLPAVFTSSRSRRGGLWRENVRVKNAKKVEGEDKKKKLRRKVPDIKPVIEASVN